MGRQQTSRLTVINGILSKAEREFLRGEKDVDDPDGYRSNLRYRARKRIQQIEADLDYYDVETVTILAGSRYIEPLVCELEAHGYDVVDYNSGLRPGERKAALKEALAPGEQSTLVADGGRDER